MSSWAFPSWPAVTVTVCGVSQLSASNVRLLGETPTSPSTPPIVIFTARSGVEVRTSPGAEVSTTSYVALPPSEW